MYVCMRICACVCPYVCMYCILYDTDLIQTMAPRMQLWGFEVFPFKLVQLIFISIQQDPSPSTPTSSSHSFHLSAHFSVILTLHHPSISPTPLGRGAGTQAHTLPCVSRGTEPSVEKKKPTAECVAWTVCQWHVACYMACVAVLRMATRVDVALGVL